MKTPVYRLVRRQFRERRYPMVVYSQPPGVWPQFSKAFLEGWRSYWRDGTWIWVGLGILLGIALGRL